ncbi:MAG: PAS domain S-box protein [Kiritimatiellia bacterium]
MTARSSSDAPLPRPSGDAYGVQPIPPQEAPDRLQATLNALPDILFVLDRGKRILDFHAPHPELLYVPPEQFLGRTINKVVPLSAAAVLDEAMEKALAEGKHRGCVYSLPSPGGERWFEASIAVQGKPASPDARLVVIVRDVTERVRVEEALRESEARFDQSAQQSRTVVWEVDAEGRFTFVSHVVESVLGYRPEELVGQRHFYDLYPEESLETVRAAMFEVFRRRDAICNYESLARTKDGRSVWVVSNGIPRLNADGTLRGYRGSNMDITERKRAEEALRESEERARAIHDNLPDGLVYQIDSGGDGQQRRFSFVSKGVERLHGITADEAARDAGLIYGQVLEEDRPKVAEQEVRAVATMTPLRVEVRRRLPSGEIRWSLFMSAPRRMPNGHLVWDGVELDVTERKRAEEALRESETKYRRLHETMRDAFVSADMEGRILENNAAFQVLTGYFGNELLGMRYQDLTPEKWRAAEAKIVAEQVLPRGYSDVYQKEYVRKDGTTVPVELRTILIRDEAGRPTGMWASIRNVTARLRVERALKQATVELDRRVKERTADLEASRQALAKSEAQFREMAANIQDVFWLIDAKTGRALYVSPAFEIIWGRSPQKENPSVLTWAASLHPDDRNRALQAFRQGLAVGRYEKLDVRVVRPDGSIRWIEVSGWIVRTAPGESRRIAGVMRDITDRRRLEAEILAAAETERLRIGRDLHDGLGQALTGIGYMAEAVREDLARRSLPEAADVGKLAELIEKTAAHAHALARGLLLVELKRYGLGSALRELASQTQELFGVACRYEGPDNADGVDADVATHLYCIAQEAASNAAKHSQGKTIAIRLFRERDGLLLSIHDTGRGLSGDGGNSSGMGMDIMRYRAGIIGADFWIDSETGMGTCVNCRLSRAAPSGEIPP